MSDYLRRDPMSDYIGDPPPRPRSWIDRERYPYSGVEILDPVIHQGKLMCCWIISLARQMTALFRIHKLMSDHQSFSIENALEGIHAHYTPWLSPDHSLRLGVHGLSAIAPYFTEHGLSAVPSFPETFESFSLSAAEGRMNHNFYPFFGHPGCVVRKYTVYTPNDFENRVHFYDLIRDLLIESPLTVMFLIAHNANQYNYGTSGIYRCGPTDSWHGHIALAAGSEWDDDGNFYVEVQETYGRTSGVDGIGRLGIEMIQAFVYMEL